MLVGALFGDGPSLGWSEAAGRNLDQREYRNPGEEPKKPIGAVPRELITSIMRYAVTSAALFAERRERKFFLFGWDENLRLHENQKRLLVFDHCPRRIGPLQNRDLDSTGTPASTSVSLASFWPPRSNVPPSGTETVVCTRWLESVGSWMNAVNAVPPPPNPPPAAPPLNGMVWRSRSLVTPGRSVMVT